MGQLRLVDENFDIDTYEDLKQLIDIDIDLLTIEQKELVLWLKEILLD